jgi:hypothetical protein
MRAVTRRLSTPRNFTSNSTADICVNTYAIDTRRPDGLYACCSTLATQHSSWPGCRVE